MPTMETNLYIFRFRNEDIYKINQFEKFEFVISQNELIYS